MHSPARRTVAARSWRSTRKSAPRKKINDAFGHATGDALLQQVVSRLRAELRDIDTVSRIGGDEFVCIIAPPSTAESAQAIAGRLRKAVGMPYSVGDDTYVVGCSIGVSLYPQHGTTSEVLLARADSAMYAAKATGGGVQFASAVAEW